MCVNPKTILIWGQKDLLCTSVELFLNSREEWNVISLSKDEKIETLMLTVEEVQPDIVILEDRLPGEMCLLLQILDRFPQLRVITVNLNDNVMEVYSKQNVLAKTASDLLSVVNAWPVHPFEQLFGEYEPGEKGGEAH